MAAFDLGPKRWRIGVSAAEIDEDTGCLMIDLSLLPSSFWTTVNATDGRDIRVTADDGDTELPVHIIGFVDSGTTGVGWLRVGVSVSASVDSEVYIYAGDGAATMPAITDPNGARAAYDASVAAAWWFEGGSLVDIITGLTLTNNNAATATTGPVAGLSGFAFVQASSQYLSTTSPPRTGLPAQIETWTYTTDNAVEQCPVTLGNSASAGANLLSYYVRGNIANDPTATLIYGGGGTGASPLINTHPYSSWVHSAVSRDAVNPGTSTIHRHGSVATSTATIGTAPTYNRLFIGALHWSGANTFWKGNIGPTFVHSTVRSANYLSTIRNMILTPSDVYSIGSMEEAPAVGDPGTTGWMKLQSVSQAGGDVNWVNLSNAVGTIVDYASVELDDGEYSAAVTLDNPDYDITIPPGATGLTVDFRIRCYREETSGKFNDTDIAYARVSSGQVGANMATAAEFPNIDEEIEFTPTGHSWSVSDFDADLGLDLQLVGVSTPGALRDSFIYLAWVRVNWETSGSEEVRHGDFFQMYR